MFTPAPFIRADIRQVSYVNHVTDSTFPMTLMANINAGDLLVFLELNRDNSPPIATAAYPSGWTQIGTYGYDASNNTRICASYKVAIGNEDSTNITGMAEDQFWDGIAIQYRANRPLVGLSVSTPVGYGGSADPSPLTIAAASGKAPVLGICNYCTYDQSINSQTTSITPNHEISSSSVWYLRDYVQNSNPQNFTFDMGDEGSDNILFGFYLHNFR